jgi:hypothetical protein
VKSLLKIKYHVSSSVHPIHSQISQFLVVALDDIIYHDGFSVGQFPVFGPLEFQFVNPFDSACQKSIEKSLWLLRFIRTRRVHDQIQLSVVDRHV